MNFLRTIASFVIVAFATPSSHAAIVWNYVSTGTGVVLSGQATTDGDLADLVAANSFRLVSIDTVFLNGVDITAASNWSATVGATGPPFATEPSGNVLWDTTQGVVDTDFGDVVLAADAIGINIVQLAVPGSTLDTLAFFNAADNLIVGFKPTSTIFTVVPEPSAMWFLLIASAVAATVCVYRRGAFRFT